MGDDERFDVVISGGGMTGGMLAAALAAPIAGAGGASTAPAMDAPPGATTDDRRPVAPLRVCVLEAARPEPFAPGTDPGIDIRVSALSIATERMFRRVGAWDGVVSRRACPYREMVVWDGVAGGGDDASSGFGPDPERLRTRFDADEIDADALGHIVENRVVQLALLECLERAPNVTVKCPERLASFRVTDKESVIELESGTTLRARLLVGADGAGSTVRTMAGIEHDRSAYDQHALVATVRTALPQQSVTWQRFVPSGPQAFLPLAGPHASMVWYHEADEVARLSALDDAAFAREMEAAFPAELGGIDAVLARASFPIAKAHASRYIEERVALIGDAAHTVHPLAGQGVNLGMLDAAALAEVLLEAAGAGRDIGRLRTLRRYERWRRGENAMMIAALDGFHHAFGPQPAPLRVLRRLALGAADRAGPLKRLVMRRAMGTVGDLPALAR